MRVLNIDHFNSVSNCSRFSSNHPGLCIFVQQDWQTKEVNYLKGRESEKVFEITVVGMVDFKFTLARLHKNIITKDIYYFYYCNRPSSN